MDTGRGVIAKKQIFNLEKIIKISNKLVITGRLPDRGNFSGTCTWFSAEPAEMSVGRTFKVSD